MDSNIILLVGAIAGGLFLLWIILYFIPVGLWFQALVSDVKISLLQLVLMRWRKVPPTVIVGAMIEGKKAVKSILYKFRLLLPKWRRALSEYDLPLIPEKTLSGTWIFPNNVFIRFCTVFNSA